MRIVVVLMLTISRKQVRMRDSILLKIKDKKPSTTMLSLDIDNLRSIVPRMAQLAIPERYKDRSIYWIRYTSDLLSLSADVMDFVTDIIVDRDISATPEVMLSALAYYYDRCDIYHPEHYNVLSLFSRDRYKIVLEGEPGTGKSSIVNFLTSMSLNHAAFPTVTRFNTEKPNPFVAHDDVFVIEDVDLLLPNGRKGTGKERERLQATLDKIDNLPRVILTTNNIDNLDKALLRKGRIDFIFKIGLLGDLKDRQILIRKKAAHYARVKLKIKLDDKELDWVVSEVIAKSDSNKPCDLSFATIELLNEIQSDSIQMLVGGFTKDNLSAVAKTYKDNTLISKMIHTTAFLRHAHSVIRLPLRKRVK